MALYQELTKINKYEKLLCARLCNEGDDEKARYEECLYVYIGLVGLVYCIALQHGAS